ncbi:hypothetical protein QBC32DRAFT_340107 [Pseudoneurospora amorphoporcata]|uniref:Uncharacterized protein n=1 Tax=Pseudoneurospora amorphoporcata TaxID=241081 RepID=A0AAN6NW74_9PEZI|nr:hypothetical protein QBC32DRAFT_340107 [Pseudoneurospora amorphoporcata]
MPSLSLITSLITLLAISANVNGEPLAPSLDNRDGSDHRDNRHYPHPPHDPPHDPPHAPPPPPLSITVTPTTTTTAAPTITPPSIVSVPIVSSFETTIDLGVTQQPRGAGKSLPVQPTTSTAVIKRT